MRYCFAHPRRRANGKALRVPGADAMKPSPTVRHGLVRRFNVGMPIHVFELKPTEELRREPTEAFLTHHAPGGAGGDHQRIPSEMIRQGDGLTVVASVVASSVVVLEI